jgi:hypothetical protein
MSLLADVTLSPKTIELSYFSESQKLQVLNNGKPVLPAEISKIAAGVFKTGDAVPKKVAGRTHFSNYSHMFSFTINDDGSITVTPVESQLQLGKYDLYVYTTHGTGTGTIDAHLEGSIPPRPPRKASPSIFTYDFELPVYLYGQAVTIDLGPNDRHTYSWYVNGELRASGKGLSSFRTWPDIGDHEISFSAINANGEMVSKWTGTVKVAAEEPIRKTVRKGRKLTFSSPTGFSHVTWKRDGKVLLEETVERTGSSIKTLKFNSRGSHTVTCHLRGKENDDFREISWTVEVK